MTKHKDLADDFWNAIESDRTVMLGGLGAAEIAARPMTAQVNQSRGRRDIYFFASRDEGIGHEFSLGTRSALMCFESKGHDICASGSGLLSEVSDHAMIDRLWTPFAAIYYKDGRHDPKLILLHFDAETFDIWRNSTTGFVKSVFSKLLGRDAGQASLEDRGEILAN